jgi:hypothetical protein
MLADHLVVAEEQADDLRPLLVAHFEATFHKLATAWFEGLRDAPGAGQGRSGLLDGEDAPRKAVAVTIAAPMPISHGAVVALRRAAWSG